VLLGIVAVLIFIVLEAIAKKTGTIFATGTGTLTLARPAIAIAYAEDGVHKQPGRQTYGDDNSAYNNKFHRE
jgi:hypothetical protein